MTPQPVRSSPRNFHSRTKWYAGLKTLAVLALILSPSACQPQQPGALVLTSPEPGPSSTPTSQPSPVATQTPIPLSPTPLPPTPSPLPSASPSPTEPPVTTLLFTGIIVPARCIQAAIDESGDADYPYEEVREIISAADLAIGTLNATISDYPPHTGCVPTFVLVGGSGNADALARAGFDAMSVATNHIKNCGLSNCGDRAFFDTLENLRRVGVKPVGAGANLAEAMQPLVLEANGVRFGIVSLGQIEPMAFAGEDTPGIAVLTPENMEAAIAAARQVSDVVIAMPHWGPEYVSTPTWIQRNLAQQIVAAGADLVVGNHTHVVQGLQEINGVPVFYGLGNFVFDQSWQPELAQSVILQVQFEGTRYLGYELIPAQTDGDGRVHIAGPAEAQEILERIEEASRPLR